MDRKEFSKAYGELVRRPWSDEEFKKRLLVDPRAVLSENGIEVPEGVDVRVVENTPQTVHFILPRPIGDELSEEELEAAGGSQGSADAKRLDYELREELDSGLFPWQLLPYDV